MKRTVTTFTWAVALLLSTSALAKAPRLTVFISVDAFGSDLFQKNRSHFRFGLARLINEGALVPQVRYEGAENCTATGHATLATGAQPSRHGIVGNRTFNRTTGKLEAIFADPGHPVLEAPLGPDDVSPAALLSETLSDHLRAATALKGKSVSVSGKGRSAIAMAGRLGDAWWFHEQLGKFITGTWYRKETPAWVKAFNDKKLADASFAKKWELTLPAASYLGEDDRPYEADASGLGRTFPHVMTGGLPSVGPQSYSALATSPFMNDLEVEFAKAALDAEGLGKDDVPDLLSVSFSAVDRTFHVFGPNSWEMQDQLMRLDKSVGDLLAAAERAAGGRQNLVVVLSADHGGAAVPEEYAAMGLDGVRVNPASLQKTVDDELASKFAQLKGTSVIAAIEETDVYFDAKVLSSLKLEGATVRRAAAAALMKNPDVAVAIARDDLFTAADPSGLIKALATGYFPDRSGDVLVTLKPFHVFEEHPKGTSHGTPYAYDAEVPLILWGRGVKPGVYPVQAHAVDIAPTTAALMELGTPAEAQGQVVSEALALPK